MLIWLVVALASGLGIAYYYWDVWFQWVLNPLQDIPLFLLGNESEYLVALIAVIAVFTFLAKLGIETYSEVRGGDDVKGNLFIGLYTGAFLFALYVLSWIFIFYVRWLEDAAEGFIEHLWFFIMALIGIIFLLYTILAGLLLIPLSPFFVIFFTPFLLLSVYGVFVTGETKTTALARTHASNSRPNDQILKELSKAMRTGMASDTELHKIVHELSPIRRFFTELTYKREVEKYREVRKILDEEAKAIQARADIGESSLELELARRDD